MTQSEPFLNQYEHTREVSQKESEEAEAPQQHPPKPGHKSGSDES